ncbi:MAG: hypothetical protein R3Y66_08870, partial [Rikenellaceae bacterium]
MSDEVKEAKKPMSEERRKQIEKLVLYPIVGLIGLLIMWFIFAPPSDGDGTTQSGFNVNVPTAVQEEMAEDKQDAYAKDVVAKKDKQREDIKTLAESMIEEQTKVELTNPTQKSRPNYTSSSATPKE